jgi:hypothetical protein
MGYISPLVVVKGFGLEPMMLLTSCPLGKQQEEGIWRIVEYYLARWKCDESYCYIKQCDNLEGLRVQSYISIRNIAILVLAVSYFASVYLGQSVRMKMLVERIFIISKRFLAFRASLIMPLPTGFSICSIRTRWRYEELNPMASMIFSSISTSDKNSGNSR